MNAYFAGALPHANPPRPCRVASARSSSDSPLRLTARIVRSPLPSNHTARRELSTLKSSCGTPAAEKAGPTGAALARRAAG